jgi:hypothetical protein
MTTATALHPGVQARALEWEQRLTKRGVAHERLDTEEYGIRAIHFRITDTHGDLVATVTVFPPHRKGGRPAQYITQWGYRKGRNGKPAYRGRKMTISDAQFWIANFWGTDNIR